MRTRNSYFLNNSNVTIPRRRNKGRAPNIVEPELRTIVAPMAERTMEELLRATTEGYREAIVLPEINADHFEINTNLLQLVQANPFYGRESENPHAHINSFKMITSTSGFRNVPNDVIKLMMFLYSLEGAAKTWYEKEPPNSILTWEDLVTKFVNQFFPPLPLPQQNRPHTRPKPQPKDQAPSQQQPMQVAELHICPRKPQMHIMQKRCSPTATASSNPHTPMPMHR
ncbi:reverse transcriptase domain-containing protein [Tanacetum coccineum]